MNAEKKDRLLTEFRDMYNKMAWLNEQGMKDSFEDYTSSEVHCIEAIGKYADSNVTKLAESFYMTRGAISKLTKKLMQKGAIESYQRPENKKEIYFRLTDEGHRIFDIHESLHAGFQARDNAVFEQITDAQFDDMLRFVEAYSQHLDVEIKKLGPDRKPE